MGATATGSRREDKFRNFDSMRLFAAVAVIFGHGFLIAEGTMANEPLQRLTGQNSGLYGVSIFFVMSGFLITRSWFASQSPGQYARKRFLRIYPAYFVSVFVSVLILAPFWYAGGPWVYFHQPETYLALLNGLTFNYLFSNPPGVTFYADADGIGHIVNGVYWSLQAEVLLYSLVAVLGALEILRGRIMLALAIGATICSLHRWYFTIAFPAGHEVGLWALMVGAPGFFSGSFLYFHLRDREPSTAVAAVLALAALIVPLLDLSAFLPPGAYAYQLFPVLSAYPIIWLGSGKAPHLGNWTRWGDLSYGLYLFGWPIQEVLRSVIGPGTSGPHFFVPTIALSLLSAWLSWTLVERPALKLKLVRRNTWQPG